MHTDPIARFSEWLTEAETSEPNDPNAVALATVDERGQPSVRMVLLKGLSDQGFVFYTNQQSRKADDLMTSAKAALLFHWKTLRRQVRVEGPVSPVAAAEADSYFATRGRTSQLGAWASDQSRPMPDRATFEARIAAVTERFAGQDVPRPPHWSGYRVAAQRLEFWTDMPGRLHLRELYTRGGDGWQTGLLYP